MLRKTSATFIALTFVAVSASAQAVRIDKKTCHLNSLAKSPQQP